MSKSNIRSIVSAIFVIVCVSLSCGFPRFTPKGVDLDDEMFQYLNTNMAGTFIKDDMVSLPVQIEVDKPCPPPEYLFSNTMEILEFKENKLIITGASGMRTYAYQPFGDQQFCRELDDGKIELIRFITLGPLSRMSRLLV